LTVLSEAIQTILFSHSAVHHKPFKNFFCHSAIHRKLFENFLQPHPNGFAIQTDIR